MFKKTFKILLISFLFFSCTCSIASSNNTRVQTQNLISSIENELQIEIAAAETAIEEPIIEEIPRYTLTFLAAGDNLFHDSLMASHRQQDNSYNFDPIYTEVKDIVQSADIAFINQETVMAGTRFGYSGYPLFNSPQSLARTLADTGFDIVNLANNHAMDKGRDGLYATLDFLDTISEFTVIGARKEGESKRIITKNNITLGFLSYTYGLNGFVLPRDNPNLVSLINRTVMAREINELRPLCDFLIVSMHWGAEYRMIEPDNDQISLARFLAEHNVDLIVGHHPHVLQRVERLPRPDGKETLCFYSLGNFVSHQNRKERVLGAFMLVTFVKEGDSDIVLSIENEGIIPVVTHFEPNFRNTKIIPLYEYTEELLARHILRPRDAGLNFDFFNSTVNNLQTTVFTSNPFN